MEPTSPALAETNETFRRRGTKHRQMEIPAMETRIPSGNDGGEFDFKPNGFVIVREQRKFGSRLAPKDSGRRPAETHQTETQRATPSFGYRLVKPSSPRLFSGPHPAVQSGLDGTLRGPTRMKLGVAPEKLGFRSRNSSTAIFLLASTQTDVTAAIIFGRRAVKVRGWQKHNRCWRWN